MTLQRYLARLLGGHELVQDHTWPHRASAVLEVRDATGARWFVKRHSSAERYRVERDAYHDWVPVLGERAPMLRDSDDQLRVLVLTSIPGRPVVDADVSTHHQAGALLRRLHAARPAQVWPEFAAERSAELQRWSAAAAGLLERRVLDFARSEVTAAAQLPPPDKVVCHFDYSPRNWLAHEGVVSVLDFEWCRLDVWVNDLTRLCFGSWIGHPELQEAFLDGYGRPTLTQVEEQILAASGAVRAIELVVRARQYGERALEESSRQALTRLMQR